jgi:type I restriction enzyme S subunit
VRSLEEIAHFRNGLALQRYPPKSGGSLPVIKIAQLRSGNADGADAASADLSPDFIVEDGDVLFSWSGTLECTLWAGGKGALNQHLFKVTSTDYPKWLYYLWIHQHLEDFRHIAAGKATTMGHIQRHHLSDAKVVLPPPALQELLDPVIGPLIEGQWLRRVQSRVLSGFRDTLLPKLVSGELRIRDVDRIVRATT